MKKHNRIKIAALASFVFLQTLYATPMWANPVDEMETTKTDTALGYHSDAGFADNKNCDKESTKNNTAIGSNAKATVGNSTAIGAGAQANAKDSVALGVNSVANEQNTVSVGSTNNTRRITNVADGINPTDAVNVRQLGDVKSNVATNTTNIATNTSDITTLKTDVNTNSNQISNLNSDVNNLSARIDSLSSRLDKVGALAAAFSALAPMPYDAAQPTQMSIGAGTYSGQQAMAIGIYHYTKNDVLLNAGIAISGSETMGRIGVTWKIGGSSKATPVEAVTTTPAITVTATKDGDITSRVKRILDESEI